MAYRSGRKLHVLMWEAALRSLICPPSVLASQLDRLNDMIGMDTVELGVITLRGTRQDRPRQRLLGARRPTGRRRGLTRRTVAGRSRQHSLVQEGLEGPQRVGGVRGRRPQRHQLGPPVLEPAVMALRVRVRDGTHHEQAWRRWTRARTSVEGRRPLSWAARRALEASGPGFLRLDGSGDRAVLFSV